MAVQYRVLFISSWLPSKVEPFNGDFVERHAIAVSSIHHVEILHAVGVQGQKSKFSIEEDKIEGIRKVVAYYSKSPFRFVNLIRRFRAYRIGFRKMNVPDLVHANVLKDNMLFAVYLKKVFRIPFVVSEHWTIFQPERHKELSMVKLWIARFIGREAAIVLPVSHDLAEQLKRLKIARRMTVVSNVVDTRCFCPPQIKVKSKTIRFLHISNLIPRKRPLVIIQQIIQLREKGLDVSLHIGGNGDLSEIRQIISDNHATDYIHCFGSLTQQEVADKMKAADVFVLFSEQENLPCVLLEAMSCGIPFISSDVGGIRELMDGHKGLLMNKEQPSDLFEALKKTVQREVEWTDPITLHQFIAGNYSQAAIARQFNSVYQKVLKQDA